MRNLISVSSLILFFLNALPASAGTNEVWASGELNKSFMQTLNKQDCMNKQLSELKSRCTDKACLENLARITGDCVTFSKGGRQDFCKTYFKKNVQPYCDSKHLNGEQCVYLMVGYDVFCKSK